MGLLVEGAIQKAIDAMQTRSADLVEGVFQDEEMINAIEIEIDDKGHALCAVSTGGGDLRLLAMILKINTDLERMGDHAVNIAQCSKRLLADAPLAIDFPLPKMGESVQRMVRDALDCFMNKMLIWPAGS